MPDRVHLPKVSAITTCKGRLEHLKETLPRLMAQPFAEVIVVDYDDPDHAGDWAEAAHPGVTVVRAPNRPLFHCAAARNLGGRAASAPWLLFIDVDVRVAPGFLAAVGPTLRRDAYAMAQPLDKQCWGTMFMTRDDYEAVGGYDETIRNWGGEDTDIVLALKGLGRGLLSFDGALLDPIPHSDAVRVRHHDHGDRAGSGRRNGVYSLIKHALARQGLPMDAAARAKLYEAVCRGLDAEPMARSFDIAVWGERLYGVEMWAKLKFELSPWDDPEAGGDGN